MENRYNNPGKFVNAALLTKLILAFTFLLSGQVLAQTPSDQNFDAEVSNYSETGGLDIGGIRYITETSGYVHVDDPAINFVSNNPSFSGKAILMTNQDSPSSISDAYAEFKTIDNSQNFKIAGFDIETYSNHSSGVFATHYTLIGYDDGAEQVSVTVDMTTGGTYGSGNEAIVYNQTHTDGNGGTSGDMTFGSAWENIDQLRFLINTPNPGYYWVGLDNIDFEPAIAYDSNGDVTAGGGVTEPVGLPTTATSPAGAVNVFDFTISDGGGDGFPLNVSALDVNVSGTSTDADRGKVTWRLDGPDVSNLTGTYDAGTDKITFSGLNISVPDGADETYTINAYYNDNTGLTEDRTFILTVDGDTDLTLVNDGSKTQMGTTSAVTNGSGSTIDITASQLAFTTQPVGSVSGSALTTQPVVTAQDADGNTDVDFTETITLSEASAGSLTNNTQAANNGVATFTGLTYTATADQESFTLTANDQDGVGSNLPTVDANSVTSDVVAIKLVFNTQPVPTSFKADGTSISFTTVPVVAAVDANDVVDTGYSIGITLAEVNGTALLPLPVLVMRMGRPQRSQ